MRILIVASFNKACFAPFIVEQGNALQRLGCKVDWFGLQGKGMKGYVKNLPLLKKKIHEFQPDLIHAHYGLSGLFANLQRRIPVVTTYHGSDINDKAILRFSRIAMKLSAWNIFVSRKTLEIAKPQKKFSLLPCGIDISDLQLTSKIEAREKMHLDPRKRYVLFAGAFDNPIKNAPLAQQTIAFLGDEDVELLELKGYSRDEVTLLMCAVDAFLMTSFTEGSPQVIKEALACGCPIVSVDVGDVRERIGNVEGCFVSDSTDSTALSALLRKAVAFQGKTNGREKIINDGMDNQTVVKSLLDVYSQVCKMFFSIDY